VLRSAEPLRKAGSREMTKAGRDDRHAYSASALHEIISVQFSLQMEIAILRNLSNWDWVSQEYAVAWKEATMAQLRHENNHAHRDNHAHREADRRTEHGARETERATQHGAREAEREADRGVELLRQQTERIAETGREGARQAGKISAAAFAQSARTGSTLADATRDVLSAWAHYTEDVMRNTSQATDALLRSSTFSEMMQVQANLVHDNMQSFLNHSAKLADTARQLAMRPFEG
jgi:Phasin protein